MDVLVVSSWSPRHPTTSVDQAPPPSPLLTVFRCLGAILKALTPQPLFSRAIKAETLSSLRQQQPSLLP